MSLSWHAGGAVFSRIGRGSVNSGTDLSPTTCTKMQRMDHGKGTAPIEPQADRQPLEKVVEGGVPDTGVWAGVAVRLHSAQPQ
ncbi:uncharacterized protein SPSK_06802 [Sporothrix schenckii 1099-18]|uniref:Uncharacterized protein n=1 Tax=Sporothrix schenckii 1099-18 TaxID=1397361 RepID=A0A0F2MII0_SPOSC|nr:uncharacterized protein SPSK_06802 [Sporothrix schenckii 1099-18]KJR89498.1 hypothetical protein SPSK_06802 [Sporothrix schenckii 1099-18]